MPTRHPDHTNLLVFNHPLIEDKLRRLRDETTPSRMFRLLLNEIAGLMTFRVSDDFAVEPATVRTPLEEMEGARLTTHVTLVPILRAGIGMTDGILALMPEARVGHIGLYRNEETLEPVTYYCKLPADTKDGPVLLIDPMLATGGSASAAIDILKQHGCTDIRFLCLVCAPEGVERLRSEQPAVPVYTAALDRKLDENGYIRPGLGDAGDRIFGTQ